MRAPDFRQFRLRLLQAGVAPRHVRRMLAELTDHYEDLYSGALCDDMGEASAAQFAAVSLGEPEMLARAVIRQRELRRWPYRYPRIALFVLPVACLVALPAMPLAAGAVHAKHCARWGACLMLSALLTCAMLLAMQYSISL